MPKWNVAQHERHAAPAGLVAPPGSGLRMNVPAHLRLEEARLSPGQEWTDASPAWRFVRVSLGAAYWLGAEQAHALPEAALIVLAPGFQAVVRASQLNDVVLHVFKFVPELLFGFFTVSEREFFESEAATSAKMVHELPPTHPASQRFTSLLAQRDPSQEIVERAVLLTLVATFFLPGLARYSPPGTSGFAPRNRFLQVVTEMADAELLRHSQQELAGLCGCTQRHFSRLFRQYFGHSLRAHQTELRLQKARQMLDTTDLRINQIASECGYQSLSLFHSLFKRRFGKRPSQWRQPPRTSTAAAAGSSFLT